MRFRRPGEGLLELLFEDGSRIVLDLDEAEIVEAYAKDADLDLLRQIIRDSLGWSLEDPDNTTEFEGGI